MEMVQQERGEWEARSPSTARLLTNERLTRLLNSNSREAQQTKNLDVFRSLSLDAYNNFELILIKKLIKYFTF